MWRHRDPACPHQIWRVADVRHDARLSARHRLSNGVGQAFAIPGREHEDVKNGQHPANVIDRAKEADDLPESSCRDRSGQLIVCIENTLAAQNEPHVFHRLRHLSRGIQEVLEVLLRVEARQHAHHDRSRRGRDCSQQVSVLGPRANS